MELLLLSYTFNWLFFPVCHCSSQDFAQQKGRCQGKGHTLTSLPISFLDFSSFLTFSGLETLLLLPLPYFFFLLDCSFLRNLASLTFAYNVFLVMYVLSLDVCLVLHVKVVFFGLRCCVSE